MRNVLFTRRHTHGGVCSASSTRPWELRGFVDQYAGPILALGAFLWWHRVRDADRASSHERERLSLLSTITLSYWLESFIGMIVLEEDDDGL